MCEFAKNPFRKDNPDWSGADFAYLNTTGILEFHKTIPGYAPTPLVSLPNIAKELGIKELFVKDESYRFGIKAFKALGAGYAIHRVLQERKEPGIITFCAATDGNHGRAVAWTARRLGHKAVIYMPDNTALARVENIKAEGAVVELVQGTFDDCVEQCARDAEKNHWQAISDTAYEGYMAVPRYIMLGYTTLFRETEAILHREGGPGIDFLFLPAGVGGVAAAGTSYYVKKYANRRPGLICVEPLDCDCFLESVRYGKGLPLPTRGKQESIMAGLNCGIPSPVAWPVIRDGMDLFMAVSDDYARRAMRMYAGAGIVSGESGASGLAGLLALLHTGKTADLRREMGFGHGSRVLLINTEGDTDPQSYRTIVHGE